MDLWYQRESPKIFTNVIHARPYFAVEMRNNQLQYFKSKQPFVLESGTVLPEITIAYHTYGVLKGTDTQGSMGLSCFNS